MTDRLRNAQRHERLKELMTAKIEHMLQAETGKKLTETQREFAEHEVERMLHSGDATEASLHRTVAQLRLIQPPTNSAPLAKPSDTAASVNASKEASHRERRAKRKADAAAKEVAAKKELAASVGEEGSLSSAAHRRQEKHSEDMWAKICEVDVEEFHKEIVDAKKNAKKKEDEQRLYLDRQVEKRREVKKKLVDEEKVFAQQEATQRLVWEEEAKKVEAARKKRHEEERKIRDEQLELARQRKLREAEALAREDQVQAAKVKEEAIREQELNLQRKAKAREEVVKAQAFNTEYRKARGEQLQKEVELDKVHQKLFLERLEQQERERDTSLQKMQDKQRKQHTMAMQMQATIAEKAADDERKAQEYLAKVKAREEDEARRKAEKANTDKVKVRQYLTLQMLEHDKVREQEREELQRAKEQIQKEQEEAERREAERKVLEKQKALQHRRGVEEQIEAQSLRHEAPMSDKERSLNAQLLTHVAESEQRHRHH